MRPIPPKMREQMAEDQFYKKCCLWKLGGCEGKIEWHHNLIFGGRQVNEVFCILPLCVKHHVMVYIKKIKDLLNLIMLSRATPEQLARYSKAVDLVKLKERLTRQYKL